MLKANLLYNCFKLNRRYLRDLLGLQTILTVKLIKYTKSCRVLECMIYRNKNR